MNQNPEDYHIFHNVKLSGVKTVDLLIWNELEDYDDFFFNNVLPKEFEHFVKDITVRNGLNHFSTYIFSFCRRDSLKAYYRQFSQHCDNDFQKYELISISNIAVDDENLGMYYRCDKCIFSEALVKYISLRCGSVVIFSPHDFELDILSEKILSCLDKKKNFNISDVARTFCPLGCLLVNFYWGDGEAVFQILS